MKSKLRLIIKLLQLLSLVWICSSNTTFDPNAMQFQCPETLNTPTLLNGVGTNEDSERISIVLPLVSTNELCTLSRVINGRYIPYVSHLNIVE